MAVIPISPTVAMMVLLLSLVLGSATAATTSPPAGIQHTRIARLLEGASAPQQQEPDEVTISTKIIDGIPVADAGNEFDFFVTSFQGNALCGGTLIGPDIVLTAAHCQGAFNKGVVLGGAGLTAQENNQVNRQLIRPIDQQRAHVGYYENRTFIAADIMVLRLSQPLSSSENVGFVDLNQDEAIPANEQDVIALGFGLTVPGEFEVSDATDPSTELLQVTLEATTPEKCAADLSEFDNVQISDDILCAGYAGDKSICQGDSGGPLLLQPTIGVNGNGEISKTWTQVGITSFTNECRADPTPNGFARVSYFYDWIQQQVCDMSREPPESCRTVTPPAPSPAVATPAPVPDGMTAFPVAEPPSSLEPTSIQIVIVHDEDYEETTFAIRDLLTDDIVYAGPQYVATRKFQTWETDLDLVPGPYALELYDSAGNGMTRGRDGTVEILAPPTETRPMTGTLLPKTVGDFAVSLVLPFDVPDADQTFPTTSPTDRPSAMPTTLTKAPTQRPSHPPSMLPTITPQPTIPPTIFPTSLRAPTPSPTTSPPTEAPTPSPTASPSDSPSAVPSPAPTAAPVSPTPAPSMAPVTPTPAPTQEEELDCSFRGDVVLRDGLVLREIIHPNKQTITIQMVYNGQAWLGFAFSPSGAMIGNTAVIGFPDEGTTPTVGFYDLAGKDTDLVTLLEDQTGLSDASIEQVDGQTTLTFTMPVTLDGSTLATAGESSRIIYAIGFDNAKGFHRSRGTTEVTFASCNPVGAATPPPTLVPTASPVESTTTPAPVESTATPVPTPVTTTAAPTPVTTTAAPTPVTTTAAPTPVTTTAAPVPSAPTPNPTTGSPSSSPSVSSSLPLEPTPNPTKEITPPPTSAATTATPVAPPPPTPFLPPSSPDEGSSSAKLSLSVPLLSMTLVGALVLNWWC